MVGCGVAENMEKAARNSAERDNVGPVLKAFHRLYVDFHDTNRRGPADWKELEAYATKAGNVQAVQNAQQLGCEVAWGTGFSGLPIGTHEYVLAHRPQDLQDDGGYVLFLDGSAWFLKADEIRRKLEQREQAKTAQAALAAAAAASQPGASSPAPPANVGASELTAFGKLYQQFHDTNRRGPASWEELDAYAAQAGSGAVVQSVRQLGCNVAWGTNFTGLPIGTHQYILAYRPEDLQDDGGYVLFLSGSVELLPADQMRLRLEVQSRMQSALSAANAPTAAVPAGGTAIPPGTSVASGAPLSPGQRMLAEWAGAAEEVEVLEVLPNDFVRIRWLKWGPNFDQTLPRSALQFPANATGQTPPAAGPAPPPATGGGQGRLRDFAYERRSWTDAAGKYQVTAELLDYKDGQVTLKREDGGLVTLPVEKLSRLDQVFLQSASRTPGNP
jgi:hypothetical protein